jgi:general secretion pathway protein G
MAIAGFSFAIWHDSKTRKSGNYWAAAAQINGLKAALNDYRAACGNFPTTEQGLDALVESPKKKPFCSRYPAVSFFPDGKAPKDPWDNPFVYESDGKVLKITSYGKDGKEGGEGYDQDVKSND